MKTINCKIFIAILLLTALSFSAQAQYKKLTFGNPCPFDTAVAIQINTYRAETLKLQSADGLISGLQTQIILQKTEITKKDSAILLSYQYALVYQKEVQQKQETINQLSEQFNQLAKLYAHTQTWWSKNKVIIAIATTFALTTATILYIKR